MLVRQSPKTILTTGASQRNQFSSPSKKSVAGYLLHNIGSYDIYYNFDGIASNTSGFETFLLPAGGFIADTDLVFEELHILAPTSGSKYTVGLRVPLDESEIVSKFPQFQTVMLPQFERPLKRFN